MLTLPVMPSTIMSNAPSAPKRRLWLSRRKFLQSFALGGFGSAMLSGYAFAVEPLLRLRVQNYAFTPSGWPQGFRLTIAALADIHAGEPRMSQARIGEIVAKTNALGADLILLLGDYAAGSQFISRKLPADEWAEPLADLKAPLGVHAVLGNHDWWEDPEAQFTGRGPIAARRAMEKAGIAVYENDCVRLAKGGRAFWLAGLGDQLALLPNKRSGRHRTLGVDDLPGVSRKLTGDDTPTILMAHEPDIFPDVPGRIALTLSGHTHGGQVRLFGYSPVVPSIYGNRYAYGHIIENDRHLIVSGGLGCSIVPVRFGVPPEIVHVTLGGAA